MSWRRCIGGDVLGFDDNMNVDLIFQIAGVGIVIAVLNQLLSRAGRDDMALMTTIAGLIAVLLIIIEEIGALFDAVKTMFNL